MRPFTPRPLLIALFSVSLLVSPHATPPTPLPTPDVTLDDALHQLADRIASIPNLRGPFFLQFLQDPAFASETGKDWQDAFRKELQNRHIALTDDASARPLRIGVAETPTQVVLSAAVRIADKDEVRFFATPRGSFRAANLPVAPVRIERQLVYQTPDRILDASSLWNGAEGGLAVLVARDADLSVLRIDSAGQLAQSVSLPEAASPITRDPRGEISIRAAAVTVLLPSKACDFEWSAGAEAKCHIAKTFWRLPTVLTPSCDAGGWKLLANGPDWSTPDALHVVPAAPLREGSAELLSDFPGPILSMNGQQDPAGALVVVQNLRTGNYEVYKITLVCGN